MLCVGTCSESLFRENLVKAESETEGLRRSVADLRHQIKVKDKIVSDTKKLRDIISAQDEKVLLLRIFVLLLSMKTVGMVSCNF